MEPVILHYDSDGYLCDDDENRVICSWFALCDRPATDVVQHPVLGGVPVCARCKRRVEA
jgi:hypothetical protein